MPFYDNDNCPICNKAFEPDDDIVTCPHCGTPHHRECYNSIGHCFNRDKHNSDFEYDKAQKENKNDAKNENSSVEQLPKPQINSPLFGEFGPPVNKYDNSNETIDGRSLRDIAALVRTNVSRFIPKFIKNKKVSWNWGAFFFGPYYLFFRKMYSQGYLFLALQLIADFIIQGVFADEFQKMTDFLNYANEQMHSGTITDSLIQEMQSNYEAFFPIVLIMISVTVILSVIIALFADSFYRSKVFKLLDEIDKSLEDGSMFDQTFIIGGAEQNLSQDDMKKLYLNKMGGTNIFSPLMIYLLLLIVTRLISQFI